MGMPRPLRLGLMLKADTDADPVPGSRLRGSPDSEAFGVRCPSVRDAVDAQPACPGDCTGVARPDLLAGLTVVFGELGVEELAGTSALLTGARGRLVEDPKMFGKQAVADFSACRTERNPRLVRDSCTDMDSESVFESRRGRSTASDSLGVDCRVVRAAVDTERSCST